jgi:hypothetical protein
MITTTRTADGLRTYFQDYGAASIQPHPARIAAFYADSFVVAGPRGSAVFNNDDKFIDWLRQLHDFNQRVGMRSMEVLSIPEIHSLSERQMLVRVEWGARFTKMADRLTTFQIAYLLEVRNGGWEILAYVAEKDQEEEMRKVGLL